MADQSSIWKKEISFGRRKPAPEAAERTESVWKREISLGRRSSALLPVPVARQDQWEPAKRAELWAPPLPEHREPPADELQVAVDPPPMEPPPMEPP